MISNLLSTWTLHCRVLGCLEPWPERFWESKQTLVHPRTLHRPQSTPARQPPHHQCHCRKRAPAMFLFAKPHADNPYTSTDTLFPVILQLAAKTLNVPTYMRPASCYGLICAGVCSPWAQLQTALTNLIVSIPIWFTLTWIQDLLFNLSILQSLFNSTSTCCCRINQVPNTWNLTISLQLAHVSSFWLILRFAYMYDQSDGVQQSPRQVVIRGAEVDLPMPHTIWSIVHVSQP